MELREDIEFKNFKLNVTLGRGNSVFPAVLRGVSTIRLASQGIALHATAL